MYPAKRVFHDVERAVDWILGHEEHRTQNLIKAMEENKGDTIVEQDEGDEGYCSE